MHVSIGKNYKAGSLNIVLFAQQTIESKSLLYLQFTALSST